ncbi:hypothetical protein DH2020_031859 [Rehmannia glutinosa]|uniref:Protein kinase domain-containing protein n=1 Tax=Rehmannia glutinosa TaxID=99300 RepID=A0ABR0VGV0_REHGL
MAKQTAIILLIMFLVIICYPAIFTCLAATLNSSTDESSLLSIKARITSDPNNILTTNWSQGTPFCTWIGVTCSRRHSSRVTALDLFDLGLEGTIAQEIGNLSFLTYLNVANNSFTGPIPDEIGNLSRLRFLRLSNNQLGGHIPTSLGMLTNLEMLDLSDNRLTGSVPWSGILNISSLRVIAVTRNYQLSGSLPLEMCGPGTRLEQMRLSMNQFVGSIPESISRCGQLKIISFSYNNFTGSIPVNIGNLLQLQILALGRNQLSGTIPPSIGNLSNLNTLDFLSNRLQGTVPPEMGQLSNLTLLSFGENMLHGDLPQSIFNLTRLHTISIPLNNLSGNLPPSIDQDLPNLQLLYLGGNRFSGPIPASISNLSRLTIFDIYLNSFSGIIPITLGNLHQLQVLRLSENQFTNNLSIPQQDFLTPLTNCKNLTFIRIDRNPITGVLPKSLGSANMSASLENFIAFSCRISGTIPDEIGNLKNLIWLTLGDNELTGKIPTTLGRLKNLQRLSIYENKLQGSIPPSFCSLENLYLLSLESNRLSGELPMCLGNLTSLREIYLGNNTFNSGIPSSLWSIRRIQVLSLFDNSFNGSLPPEISSLSSVIELDLHGNQLSGEIPSTIGQLQNLATLSLSDNELNGHIPESFSSLRNLHYFNVSFNELTGEIPEGGHFATFTPGLFAGNIGLCGSSRFNVEACEMVNTTKSSRNNRLIRYILPPIASMIVVTTIIILLLRHYRRKSTSVPSDQSDLAVLDRISYYEILKATNNLDIGNLIGKGSIGSVYKGTFSNEATLAVKVFDLDVQGAFKSFDIECQIMRSLRHRNLVKVITSCSNLDFKALVVEYMPNGNLEKWLYSPNCSSKITERLGILIDVASAIEYLHQGYSSPIVHCDLKPSNILLDENMVAHVGDFGISKLFMEDQRMAQTKTLGTIGYMAPEYGSSGLVSTAVDVYSYGILLMETFTRKKPTDEMFLGELTMTKWVSNSFPSALMQIVDTELLNTNEEYSRGDHDRRCLESIMRLAIHCTSDFPEERPKMEDVLVMLKKINIELHDTKHRVR